MLITSLQDGQDFDRVEVQRPDGSRRGDSSARRVHRCIGGPLDTFTAIASLFGIAAILSFVNDRFLRLQPDIGLLLLAGLTTGARVQPVLRACYAASGSLKSVSLAADPG